MDFIKTNLAQSSVIKRYLYTYNCDKTSILVITKVTIIDIKHEVGGVIHSDPTETSDLAKIVQNFLLNFTHI